MRRLALLLVVALAPGCGEVPQPFRHQGPSSPLVRPKMMRGVTVRPADESADSQALAAAVVKALEPMEIPAIVRQGPAFGHVLEAIPTEAGWRWVLTAPDGEVVPVHAHPVAAEPARIKRHAEDTATALSNRLTDPDARPPAGATAPRRDRLKLAAFKGLPGDGDKALTMATRRALERSGFLMSEQDADYAVEGRVTVIPGLPGEDTVIVTWIVKSKDGKELAAIDQEGVVPRGRLSDAWGALARDIAEGGAAGVIETVATASRNGRP